MEYINYYDSPLGKIIILAKESALTGIAFSEQKFVSDLKSYTEKELPIHNQTKKWLDIYFSGKNPAFYQEIECSGTDFQVEVWNELRKIKYGEVVTYSDIARVVAKARGIPKMSAQAIGQAVGRNKIAIIIPCHRVIGVKGNLVGYSGGLERKIKLLELESRF